MLLRSVRSFVCCHFHPPTETCITQWHNIISWLSNTSIFFFACFCTPSPSIIEFSLFFSRLFLSLSFLCVFLFFLSFTSLSLSIMSFSLDSRIYAVCSIPRFIHTSIEVGCCVFIHTDICYDIFRTVWYGFISFSLYLRCTEPFPQYHALHIKHEILRSHIFLFLRHALSH